MPAGSGAASAFLYVIEDKERGKMFVMGPAPIGSPLTDALKKNGVQYMQQADPGAVTAANEFLAEGARYRGEHGRLVPGNTQNVIESMIKACAIMFDISQPAGAPNTFGKGETVGAVLKRAKNPSVYTNIVRPGA